MNRSRGRWLRRPMVWRGFLAIAFGCYALSGAWVSPRGLSIAFGTYAALEALGALWAAFVFRSGPLMGIAVVDWMTALLLLLALNPSFLFLAYVVGGWAMGTGILELFAAGLSSRTTVLVRTHAAAGVVSILFGVVFGLFPNLPRAEVAGLIGAALVCFGVLCLPAANLTGALRRTRSPVSPRRRQRAACFSRRRAAEWCV